MGYYKAIMIFPILVRLPKVLLKGKPDFRGTTVDSRLVARKPADTNGISKVPHHTSSLFN